MEKVSVHHFSSPAAEIPREEELRLNFFPQENQKHHFLIAKAAPQLHY